MRFGRKIAYLIFLAVVFCFTLAVVASKVQASSGGVLGIFDAINNYRNREATPGSVSEIKRDYQQLNQVRTEINKEMAKKQQEMLVKYKEEVALYLDKWTEYLDNIKSEASNYEVSVSENLQYQVETDLAYIAEKKQELTTISTIEELRLFVKDLRVNRQQMVLNYGAIRSRMTNNYQLRLESKLTRLQDLFNRIEQRLDLFELRGIDVTEARGKVAQLRVELNLAFSKMEQLKNQDIKDQSEIGSEFAAADSGQLIAEIDSNIKDIINKLREVLSLLKLQVQETGSVSVTPGVKLK